MSDFVIEDGVLVKYNGNDERVVIPEGVTEIGDGAFYGCECLTEVSIPDSVTEIKNWAFSWCKSLSITKVAIPKHLVLKHLCNTSLKKQENSL